MPISYARAVLIFLLLLPFIIVLPSASKLELPQWTAASVIATLLLLIWLLSSTRRISWTPVHALVALMLVAFLLLGSIHGDAPGVQDAMLQQVTLVLFFFFGAQFLSSEQSRYQLLAVTAATGSIVAIIGIGQYFSGTSLGLPAVSKYASASVFINKNWAGSFMDLATPTALILLLTARGRRAANLATIGAFLCLGYSVITVSRGHWLALAATICILMILLRLNSELRARIVADRRRLARFTGVALTAPCLLLIPPMESDEPLDQALVFYQATDAGSIGQRLQYYRNTLQMIGDSPLIGAGPGTYYTRFQGYYNNPSSVTTTTELLGVDHAHNDYLEYLAELGLPGGAVMLGLLALIWISAWRLANNRESGDQALRDSAFLAGITAIFSHAMVDFPLSQPTPAIYLWTWAGAISGIWAGNREKAGTGSLNPKLRVPLGLTVVLYLGLVTLHGYTALKAQVLINDAAISTINKDCDRARQLSGQAFELRPKDLLIWHHQLVIHGACKSDIQTQYLQASLVLEQAPSHPYALLVRANTLLQAGKYELARADYQRLVDQLPHRALGYIGLAGILTLDDDLAGAQDNFQMASELIEKAERVGERWQTGPAGRELVGMYRDILVYSKQQKQEKADASGTSLPGGNLHGALISGDG